jgi:glyoxylase-like metal-dependent hydrolase (beta-lactamase superfamily II)
VSHPAAIQIAPGVRRVTVGAPIGSHVYLIDRPEGVIAFDAGVRGTGAQILAAAGRLVSIGDGGAVPIAGTVVDGDEIGGFRVVHVPGHAPGLIALFRDHDGLLLAADAVYTLDLETGAPVATRVPHPAVNWDTTLARRSILRLAALEPTSVRTGHSHDVESPVVQQLHRAATRDAIVAPEAA